MKENKKTKKTTC